MPPFLFPGSFFRPRSCYNIFFVMVNLTKLLGGNGVSFRGDALRYAASAAAEARRPVVVWNCTRRCDLRCPHCYAAGGESPEAPELTTPEAEAFIEELADFGVPVLLFSGGEPLLRKDLPRLLACAARRSLRTVLSTSGRGLTRGVADRLAAAGVSYVGISLDAASENLHDAFRGRPGTFREALAALDACRRVGMATGIRFTMTRRNLGEINGLFDLAARDGIERICFYHFTPAGRGGNFSEETPRRAEIRSALDRILARTGEWLRAGRTVEVLTVANHADGPYGYLHLRRENPARAEEALLLLRRNGGNRSGEAIACVSWDGSVHPDQFWRNRVLGNIRETPLHRLWSDPPPGSLLASLRNRKPFLPSRCRTCRFLGVCNGNLRARADLTGAGIWGEDPGCYLTDEEIRQEAP